MNTMNTNRRTATLLALISALVLPLVAHAQAIDPGLLEIDLGTSHQTFLGISPSSLESELCGLPPDSDTKDPKLLASNDGSHRQNALALAVTAVHPIGDGSTLELEVTTAGFQLVGSAPLATVCGSWTHRVILDPRVVPESRTLTLHRNSPNDNLGVFSGTVEFAAKIEFTEEETLEVQEIPLSLSLDLQGPWAAAPSSSRGGGGNPRGRQAVVTLPETNLVLFAGPVNGEFGALSTPNVQRSVEYQSAQGQVVLQANPASIAALNGW
ncbi:MAG: hypothetical protein SF066_10065 [Thermoanaerobaculia bacterium]|nr:hypothetical protein [Thermoanaerobaculia bacterium]